MRGWNGRKTTTMKTISGYKVVCISCGQLGGVHRFVDSAEYRKRRHDEFYGHRKGGQSGALRLDPEHRVELKYVGQRGYLAGVIS